MATILLVSPYWAPVLAGAQSAIIYENCRVANTAALTFDGGPWIYSKDIVDILDAAGAKATFFIGSSTWSFRDMTTFSEQEIIDKASKSRNSHLVEWSMGTIVDKALVKISGVLLATVRPPYGSYNQLIQDVMSSRGQAIVLWDMEIRDSTGATPDQSKITIDQVVSKAPSNVLVELLEIETTAQVVLPYAIEVFRRFHSRNAL
ncbi:Carbohydrate esterase 4 protein [Entomortierella chlamydospora]|nr:Carbohydrate esterase 4 protein [Entomortierella chlamydospora]